MAYDALLCGDNETIKRVAKEQERAVRLAAILLGTEIDWCTVMDRVIDTLRENQRPSH